MLCAALLVSLCGCKRSAEDYKDVDSGADDSDITDEASGGDSGEKQPVSSADSVFTMNYDPDSSLNPLTATNPYNQELFSLLYEGLFTVNSKFEAVGVLCSSYETADGVTWSFTLRSDVMFHDGTPFTAEDAEYSINQARVSSNYSSRLSEIASVTALGTDTLKIELKNADRSLPLLLDIPIIKAGSASDDAPIGTGPYVLYGTYGSNYLSAYESYRQRSELPIKTVYLKKTEQSKVAEEFSGRGLDIVTYDPTGVQELNLHLDYETRYYDTSTLLYLGFNMRTDGDGNFDQNAVKDAAVRRAISRLVDRDAICSDIYNKAVLPAPLALSPALSCYDEEWEADTGYSLQAFSSLFADAGMEDRDSDGFLEGPDGAFELKVIVNEENPYKVSAAEKIVSDLRNTGIKAELSILSWEDFQKALSEGDFSLYLGEAKLRQNFDLSPLLAAGGGLNFGGTANKVYASYIGRFLAAEAGDEKRAAAKLLCDYIKEEAPIIPIAYKKNAVLTHIGAASGLNPSQSNTFYGITDWNIALTDK